MPVKPLLGGSQSRKEGGRGGGTLEMAGGGFLATTLPPGRGEIPLRVLNDCHRVGKGKGEKRARRGKSFSSQ